jgi:hypothetical protein
MPVRIAEQEAEIAKFERISRALPWGPLKRDTLRHLHQLQKDLAECKMYLSKGGQTNACNRS